MPIHRLAAAAAGLAAVLTATAHGRFAETFGRPGPEEPASVKPLYAPPSMQRGVSLGVSPEVRLGAIDAAALVREDSDRSMMRYGVWRDLLITAHEGRWIDLPNDAGRLWTIDVVAEGAVAIRLHFAEVELPAGSHLSVYAPNEPDRPAGPYEGGAGDAVTSFWTPSRFGERLRVEYFDPTPVAADDARGLPFAIDGLQHVYRNMRPDDGASSAVGGCFNDVTCFPSWAGTAPAIAGIGYVSDDSLYCSGQLIDNESGDGTPYWLTANHCIETVADAESAEIYWLYQTSSCDGSVPPLSAVPQSAGCTLLSSDPISDYTLLLIDGALPSGLAYAGWTTAAIPNGTAATCIHHSNGELKRISFGMTGPGAAPNFVRVDWDDSTTFVGASGSAIFRNDTGQLFGQLYGGIGGCGDFGHDEYGSFAVTYDRIAPFMAGGSDDPYEPNDACGDATPLGPGTVSSLVVKASAEDWYRIAVPAGGQLDITVAFTHAHGDIDAALLPDCVGIPLDTSTGRSGTETLAWSNPGGATEVFLRVYLDSDTRGRYDLGITVNGDAGTLINDDCAGAVAIDAGVTPFSNQGAVTDGPAHAACNAFNDDQVPADVWFAHQATCDGPMTITTCDSANYDTKMAVYEDADCPVNDARLLGCNEDTSGCSAFTSSVTVTAECGRWYLVRIGGYVGAQGAGFLTVTCDGPGCAPACPGDTNNDGAVDIDDVINVVLDFGTDGSLHRGDVDGSGLVDIDDVVAVILAFGSCS